ncbi:MAG: GW dipeptide domain-containing protein [Ignavibacteriales bacterium]|nr:GW dipeptide domain-containing protein [Ignavibacteriales bacterium]
MRLKFLILPIVLLIVLSACTKKEDQPQQQAQIKSNVHQVVVQEAIQVSGYTYVRVKEGGKEYWMAATTMDTKQGETLYYETAMEMKNFESKELKKTFDSIYFVESLSPIPPATAAPGTKATPQKPTIEKQDVTVAPAAGGITIAQLFSNTSSYANKVVKIKGKIVKVNNGIMSKNWAHIQDGTSSGKDFDLTVTSNDMVNVGDVVTFTGKIALNKDFGFGYSYKVLLEDAKVTK